MGCILMLTMGSIRQCGSDIDPAPSLSLCVCVGGGGGGGGGGLDGAQGPAQIPSMIKRLESGKSCTNCSSPLFRCSNDLAELEVYPPKHKMRKPHCTTILHDSTHAGVFHIAIACQVGPTGSRKPLHLGSQT